MKKTVLLMFYIPAILGMEKSAVKDKQLKVQSLRALCLEFIYKNKIPRTQSSNNLLEQVQTQENVYEFYLSRELNSNTLQVLKSLLEREIPVQDTYRLIPELFKVWKVSIIKNWKSSGALEPLTSLIKLTTEKQLTNRKELLDALNLVMKEQLASFALPEFLIQGPLQNDLSDYAYGNVVTFPLCSEIPSLELKQFMKKVISAKLQPELKNSMLRRAAHQKISHNQLEYESIICCLLENGADKTILSSFEQNNLLCAT